MKLIRCRDGVFYGRRDGAMKLIRCRDGVFYWRLDGAKNKTVRCHGGIPEMVSSNFHGTPHVTVFIQGQTCFVGFGTSLNNQ